MSEETYINCISGVDLLWQINRCEHAGEVTTWCQCESCDGYTRGGYPCAACCRGELARREQAEAGQKVQP